MGEKEINSYPSVYAIGHRYIVDQLFEGPVYIEEKIDGSQFSFGKVDGHLWFRSKGAMIYPEAPNKMFAAGVEIIGEMADSLHEGWVYRGEYLSKPKHNVLAYDRIPKNNVMIFDIRTDIGESYLTPEAKLEECTRLGFECVPLLFFGSVTDPETLMKLLDTKSVLDGQNIEGFVVKNYTQFTEHEKKIVIGKYVSEAFKEVHAKDKSFKSSNKDIVEALGGSLKSEARWNKAVQHLAEAGKLEGSPRDIGGLFREVPEDILKEEEENIKDSLFKTFWPQISRVSTAGLAEWYREKLLKDSFETPEG